MHASISGNIRGLTAEHISVTFSGLRRAAYKSRFVVLGSAPCPAEVCMTSDVFCTCFPHPLVHRLLFIIQVQKQSSGRDPPLMTATYFGSICIMWSLSLSAPFLLHQPCKVCLTVQTDRSWYLSSLPVSHCPWRYDYSCSAPS